MSAYHYETDEDGQLVIQLLKTCGSRHVKRSLFMKSTKGSCITPQDIAEEAALDSSNATEKDRLIAQSSGSYKTSSVSLGQVIKASSRRAMAYLRSACDFRWEVGVIGDPVSASAGAGLKAKAVMLTLVRAAAEEENTTAQQNSLKKDAVKCCLLDPPSPSPGGLGGLTPLRCGASKLAGNLTMPIGALRT
ncbi:MAG: hypothetical protein FRX49_12823 [Trebouxia sp. A1-2]|nr:MAG: hypothetical protein FRX49_12823 [Trebouxia sp. A1-2]